MTIIAHRANTLKSISEFENHPNSINNAIKMGFNVEIDVWNINNDFFLGHDNPKYFISLQWIKENDDYLWVHCKNLKALKVFNDIKVSTRYFWHENDDYTLTSNQLIWQAHTKEVCNASIIVDLDLEYDYNNFKLQNIYGVCTDYPILLKEKLKNK